MGKIVPYRDLTAGRGIRTIRTPSGGRTRRGVRTIRTPFGGRTRRGDPHNPHTLRGSNPARRSARSAHPPRVEPGAAIRTIRTLSGGRARRGDPHNPHTLRGSSPAWRSARSAHPSRVEPGVAIRTIRTPFGVEPGAAVRTIRTPSGGRARRGDLHNPHTLRGSNPAWRPHNPHTLRGSSPARRSARSAHPSGVEPGAASAQSAHSPGVEPGAAIRTIRTPFGVEPGAASAQSAHPSGVEPGVAIRTIRTPSDPASVPDRTTIIPDQTTICCIFCVMNIDIWHRRGGCRGDPRRVAGLWPPSRLPPLTKGEKYERIRRMNPGSAPHRPRGRRVLDVPRVANQGNDLTAGRGICTIRTPSGRIFPASQPGGRRILTLRRRSW